MAILAFFGTRLGLEILAGLAIAAFGAAVYHHVWHNGYVSAQADDAPVMALCKAPIGAFTTKGCAQSITQSFADVATLKANNKTLTDSIAAANQKVQAFAVAAAKAKASADAANKQADEDATFFTERLESLKSSLAHPSADPNADTDRILRALAADRLQH